MIKKNTIIALAIVLSSMICLLHGAEISYADLKHYYCDVGGTYGLSDDETGVTVVNISDSRIKEADMDVEIISSGELFDKYAAFFDGEVIIYNVNVIYEGNEFLIPDMDIFAKIIFPDDENTAYKTADVYKINDDGTITDLADGRHFLGDANTAKLSSFGYFILAKGKVLDIDIIATPTPKPTNVPTETPEPTEVPTPEPSETAEPAYGDVDYDSIICAEDALLVLKHAARLETLSEDTIAIADVVKDNVVDANDALEILKYAAIIIRDFK